MATVAADLSTATARSLTVVAPYSAMAVWMKA